MTTVQSPLTQDLLGLADARPNLRSTARLVLLGQTVEAIKRQGDFKSHIAAGSYHKSSL
jgi:hypothetical protein